MTDKQTQKTLRIIIAAAVTGALPGLVFRNGFMIAYFSRLNIPSGDILFYLSLFPMVVFLFTVPFAYLSDHFGKKAIGYIGMVLSFFGFALLTGAGIMPEEFFHWSIAIGIVIFSLGSALLTSGWFALLSPVIPVNIRGRFFGKQRLAIQLFSILFTTIITYVLHRYSSLMIYQVILIVCTMSIIIRIICYYYIPEIENNKKEKIEIIGSLLNVLRISGYMPFCSYTFLLMLSIGACPWIFGLLEKDVLNFSEDQIVLMGNLLCVGLMAGFYVGGKMVDKIGTRTVFMVCHFAFSATLFLFLVRDFAPIAPIYYIGLLTICFGFFHAASGIAVTSEMLALIPEENKSLSTAFCTALWLGGSALSGMIFGKILKLEVLNKSWKFLNFTVSEYDTILLGCSIGVLLLVVTLGLIPSVIKEARWSPRGM